MNYFINSDIAKLINDQPTDYLGQLAAAGVYYQCYKNSSGQRLTPLVGVGEGYVSEYWFNPNRISGHEGLIRHLVSQLTKLIRERIGLGPFIFCGLIPRGGCSVATRLATTLGAKYIQLGVSTVSSEGSEQSEKIIHTVWAERKPNKGDRVVLVDGLFDPNQIDQAIGMMWEEKVNLAAVVGIINPISALDINLATTHYGQVPLICLVKQPTPVYGVSHKFVAEDVSKGNVVWQPDGSFIHVVRETLKKQIMTNELSVVI